VAGCRFKPRQAVPPHERVELWQPPVEAREGAVIVTVVPILAADAHLLCQVIVIGRDDPAFARDQQLCGRQTINLGVALSADRAAPV
jgi:hypothetical protein